MKTIIAQDLKTQFNIAIIVSRFNEDVTQKLYEGAIQRLKELEFSELQITTVWVPGAVEIPITAQRLTRTKRYEALVCLGAVIRGETSHYDYVCNQVSNGCQQIALESNLPIIFGVLTTDTEEQALARAGGVHGNKGRDAIDAAFEMVSILRQIE
jgi:6,7-dimethyl-8-ribityllumazine synthase